jgi:hypothetical protein
MGEGRRDEDKGGKDEDKQGKRNEERGWEDTLSCDTARKSASELAAGSFWRYILARVSRYSKRGRRDIGTGDGSCLHACKYSFGGESRNKRRPSEESKGSNEQRRTNTLPTCPYRCRPKVVPQHHPLVHPPMPIAQIRRLPVADMELVCAT